MTEILLPNGKFFFSDRHMACHSDVVDLLPEVCSKIGKINDPITVKTISLGRVVGKSGVVETTAEDKVYFARRFKRHGYSRFVSNRVAVETDLVTIILQKMGKDFRIVTAYIGPLAPREPEDTTMNDVERAESIKFWANHAFVEDAR